MRRTLSWPWWFGYYTLDEHLLFFWYVTRSVNGFMIFRRWFLFSDSVNLWRRLYWILDGRDGIILCYFCYDLFCLVIGSLSLSISYCGGREILVVVVGVDLCQCQVRLLGRSQFLIKKSLCGFGEDARGFCPALPLLCAFSSPSFIFCIRFSTSKAPNDSHRRNP